MSDLIEIELPREKWDVVLHALEEEMDQLEPMEDENWLGKYPGEDDAVAIGDVYEDIMDEVTE